MGESFLIFFAVIVGIIVLLGVGHVIDYLEDVIKALGSFLLGIVLLIIGISLLVNVGGWIGAIGIFVALMGVLGFINGISEMSEALKNLRNK